MRITIATLGLLLPFFLLAQVTFNDKVSPNLQEQINTNPDAYHHIYVMLEEQIKLEDWQQKLQVKNIDNTEVYAQILNELEDIANNSQAPLLPRLYAMQEEVMQESIVSLWITNVIQLKAKVTAIESISKWTEVHLLESVEQQVLFDAEEKRTASAPIPDGSEPGLHTINAHKLWEMNYTGYGTKVLVVDSGTSNTHPALRPNYWGNNVPTSQAWTGNERPETCDEHGTLVAGVAVGLDRTTNDTVGVAPDARWMSAPINFGGCSLGQETLSGLQVFQWAINPDGDPNTVADRPDVINNSWGNTNAACDRLYESSLCILEALNIAVVWAAGNSGEDGAMSIYGSQNINKTLVNSFTVGYLNGTTLVISDDSSTGPSYCPGSDSSLRIKPEVVAPGQSIRTTNPAGNYGTVSGTSFSSPHVAGALLLLREAFPEVSSEDLKLALYYSARDLGPEGEDNIYGNGLVDVFAAYNYLINTGNTPTPPVSADNEVLMVDISTERPVHCRGAIEVMMAFENVGLNNLQTLDIEYYLNGDSDNSVQTNWTGNLGKNNVERFTLVQLEGLPAGEQELTIKISNPNGQEDVRHLNNVMKHYIQIADLDYVDVTVSPQYESTVCQNSRVVLENNTELADNQTITWYDRPTTSIISQGRLGEGSPFLTDPITEATTFYADIITTSKVGLTEPGDNQASAHTSQGISFEVLSPLTLSSVKVFSENGGGHFFQILDSGGSSITRKIKTLAAGENTIVLGQNLEIGTYSIILSEPVSADKKLKISTSASFPYEVADIIRLNSSVTSTGNTTTLHYFYFYDFEVKSLHACGRTEVPVDVNNNTAPTAGFTISAEVVALDESGEISFTSTTNNGLTQYWDFGDGTQSNSTNPTHTYSQAGAYIVTQTVTNAAGCSDAVQKTIEVLDSFDTTSTDEVDDTNLVTIFPNPTSDYVFLQTRRAQRVEVELTDLFGRQMNVETKRPNATGMRLNTKNLASGIYYLIIQIDGKKIVKKLVKA